MKYDPALYHHRTDVRGHALWYQERPRGYVQVTQDNKRYLYKATPHHYTRAEVKAGLESAFGKLAGQWPVFRAE